MTPESTPPGSEQNRQERASRRLIPHPFAWVVLSISLVATAGGWFVAWKNSELEARRSFDDEAGKITAKLSERMQIYEDVLHGALGLFAASYTVERAEWRSYLDSVSIEKRFPGIDGVGFAESVKSPQMEEFLRTTREDKTPDFELKGNLGDNELLIVKYVEPEERHRNTLGWNMGSDPERRLAAERARDTGMAALTGNIALKTEGDGPSEGCMMVLPVFRTGMPTDTVEERRKAIQGWVFARFVMAQLMREVVGVDHPYVHLRIQDIAPTQEVSKDSTTIKTIFDSDPQLTRTRPQSRALFLTKRVARFGGRFWTLSFAPRPAFEASIHRGASMWVALGGTLVSFLLFGIVWTLSTTRERALAIADEMTGTLRKTNSWLDHERYLLRTLMDNLPDHIYFKDKQSRFLRNSRAHLQAFGLTQPEEASGKTDFDFFTAEHAQQAFDDEQEVMKTCKPIAKEEKETWLDGSVTWVATTKMPLYDESGQLVGTFGISHDITDRRLAEETMRKAKDAAEEANRIKSQFLASMSHELRTPLNSVIGFANILLKNKAGNLGPTELNFLDRIQANGKHLLNLINEILDLSKIEARKVELQMELVSLEKLIRDTVGQQEGLVREKPVKLIAHVPKELALLKTDSEKLRQILVNLIGNAIKFTEQGTVTVSVKADPADNRPVCIEVKDTGIGIPADKLRVIFEAFQQAEAGTARKYGGTGLGLTISQALCQLLGYNIAVESEPDKGSTFSIDLEAGTRGTRAAGMLAAASQSVQKASESKSSPAPAQKLVLVIDDELDSRTLLAHAVEDFGCHAITADSGAQGLRMAREFMPGLITVDLMMPGLDGFGVIRALKSDPALCHIPVVVVSIVAAEHRGCILGAMDILEKPVSRVDLLSAIERCMVANSPRVLIVDDEEDSRQMLAAHLEDTHSEIHTVLNGQDALDKLTVFTPDLILLDLSMPGMDGMTFLNKLRSIPLHIFTPVIVVTARELSPAEHEQLKQSVLNVVQKGENFSTDLSQTLKEFFQKPPQKAGDLQRLRTSAANQASAQTTPT